jgi:excisionase family DNA binding protein
MKVVAEPETQHAGERAVRDISQRRVSDSAASQVNRLRRSGTRVEQLLTVAEAAECVGCCEETIRRAYLARQLDVLRFGARRVRIRPSALVAWLERGGKTTAA